MWKRDFIGYHGQLPKVVWPEKAKLVLNFVLNYEEGAEASLLNGDEYSESYLADLPGAIALKGERHLGVESIFEYGSRAGIWRLLNLFNEYNIPLTIFATGLALEKNPSLAETLKNSPHEIAGHGYRWLDYRLISQSIEKEHIYKTIDVIQSLTHKQVVGWYTGRRSVHTRQILVEAGLKYDSDSYADDLPYWVQVYGRNHLIIPYQLDTNDAHYALSPGWSNGEQFYQYLRSSLDCLYREGSHFAKMMTVGLHARLSGRPGRCEALQHFIKYAKQFNDIWICKREEIANFWYTYQLQ